MTGSLNSVTLLGNLGRDPEVRSMSDGTKVANLNLATTERWKDKQTGEKKEKTEWHRVTVWGPPAEIAERFCKKGNSILVQGQLETRKWTDQEGNERYTTEVVVRGFGGKLVLNGGSDGGGSSGGGNPERGHDDMDDEIPF